MQVRFLTYIVFSTVIGVALLASEAWGCPTCKDAVMTGHDPTLGIQITKGYADSIKLLMAMPYLLFAGFVFFIVRTIKRNKHAS